MNWGMSHQLITSQLSSLGKAAETPQPTRIHRSTLLRLPLITAPLIALQNAAAFAASLPVSPTIQRSSDSLLSSMIALPPEPIALPRKKLDLTFAILLMRSGYEAVDDLDFIPMDEFQRQFWLLRQSEWEPYQYQYSPLQIKQGDLSDPLYFDFISCMQFAAVLGRAIPDAKQVFSEKCDAEEEPDNCDAETSTRLVTRNPEYQNNAALPALWEQQIGNRIYDGLVNGFRGVDFHGPPVASSRRFGDAVAGCQKILDIFLERGYAINAQLTDIHDTPGGLGSFTVILQGSAVLWGLQSLASRKSRGEVYNSYDALTMNAYLRKCGYESPKCDLSWTDTTVTAKWTVL